MEPRRNRYQECVDTGLSRDEWLAEKPRKRRRGEPDPIQGTDYRMPAPYNGKGPKGETEKKRVYDANMAYMKRVCRELVAIDVGFMAKGGYNMSGFPDAMGSCGGIAFYCEFKKPKGGVVSSAQMGHLTAWQLDGHASFIIASPDGFYRWHKREKPVAILNGIMVY